MCRCDWRSQFRTDPTICVGWSLLRLSLTDLLWHNFGFWFRRALPFCSSHVAFFNWLVFCADCEHSSVGAVRQILCHCGWTLCPMIFWHVPVGCSTVDVGCLFGFRRMSCLLAPGMTNRPMMNNPCGSRPIICSNLNRCPEYQLQHVHLDPTSLPDLNVHLTQFFSGCKCPHLF